MGLGAILSVAAPIVGSLIGNKQTNSANAAAAAKANEFTTEQMQNRHQWEVEDLRKAGLNPILSAGGTPSMGGSAKADVESAGEALSRGVSSALSARLLKEQIANMRADTEMKTTSGQLNDVVAAKTIQDRKLTMINQSVAAANAAAAVSSAQSAAAMAARDKAKLGIETEWYQRKGGRLSTALDKLNPLKFFSQ